MQSLFQGRWKPQTCGDRRSCVCEIRGGNDGSGRGQQSNITNDNYLMEFELQLLARLFDYRPPK
jgi:hypothetical protein